MNCKTPFFSIIMPVYNAEKYVAAAVSSVLSQTFDDFELLIVDDKSSDNSLQIANEFALEDSRIRILSNDKNSGVSYSRNRALSLATGTYVGFIDADDYIEKDLLESAYFELSKNAPDCLKFSAYEEYYNDGNILTLQRKLVVSDTFLTERHLIKSKMIEMTLIPLFGYIWNAFYKAQLLREYNIAFDPMRKINEDFEFNVLFLSHANSLQTIDFCGYHYAKRNNNSASSVKQDGYLDNHMMKVKMFLNMYESISNVPALDMQRIFWLYTRYAFSAIQRVCDDEHLREEEYYKIVNDKLYMSFLEVDFSNFSKKQRLMTSVLQTKNKKLIFAFVWIIDFVRSKMPFIFARIKK